MKTFFLSAIAAILVAGHAFAVPLTPGTLSSLVGLGPTGGTIGNTIFSDFMLLPGQTGATQISSDNIFVNPIVELNSPGLQFVYNVTANANELFESRISYRVSNSSIVGASVGLNGSSVTGDGATTAVLSLIEPAQSLIAFDAGFLAETPDFATFSSLTLLNVESEVVIDGGLAGRASLVSAVNQFDLGNNTAVPEPSSILIAIGLFGTFLAKCRSKPLLT